MTSQYMPDLDMALERKFCSIKDQIQLGEDAAIMGYASLFDQVDQGGDIVERGAYSKSLKRLEAARTNVKLLWQHDPSQPIGVWEDVIEDDKGLYVKGRLLLETQKGREAAALIEAGAIDGLSIGYRTVKADRDAKGRRHLAELELWEVSLVTFPMLPQARVGAKADEPKTDPTETLAGVFRTMRQTLAQG